MGGPRPTSPSPAPTPSCRGSSRSAPTPRSRPPPPSGGRWWNAWRRFVPPSKLARRLENLLVVVPYVVRHPGSRLEDLSRLFEVDEETLAADLNLLFCAGLPPYGPGDLVEVEIEQGKVWIRMADYFARPVRLTPAEALTLYLKGIALLGSQGMAEADALRSALEKLRTHLDLGKLEVEVQEASAGQVATLEELRRAVDARE